MELACLALLGLLAVGQMALIGWLVRQLVRGQKPEEKHTEPEAVTTEEERRRSREMDEGIDNLMRFEIGGKSPLYPGGTL